MTATGATVARNPELIEDFRRYGNTKTTTEERAVIVAKWQRATDPLAQRWVAIWQRDPAPGGKIEITHKEYGEWIDLIAEPATWVITDVINYACARCGETRCVAVHTQEKSEESPLTDVVRNEIIEGARKRQPLCNVCRQVEQETGD